ncbi:MAG: dienelactone hydrolase family protein [Hyphomonadaceae bacterium]
MIENQPDIATKDGATATFIVHPDRGGPFPVLIFLMDAPGIREELRDMARRFSSSGYYVMLPNLYYRSGEMELGPIDPDPEHPARKRMAALMMSIDIPMVLDDVAGLIAHAERDPAADTTRIGTIGYCMSGRYAVSAAGRWPERVRAAASIYGVRLVTDDADSPHLVARNAPAECYFACAETDAWAPPEMIEEIRRTLEGTQDEVEVYPGTRHGFAFPQRPVYEKRAAEQHWERVLNLFRRRLG